MCGYPRRAARKGETLWVEGSSNISLSSSDCLSAGGERAATTP